jgi:ubiquinone/menaquinone biosynthesis C-methylase UbiE
MRLQVLMSALEHGYFDALKNGPAAATAIAKATKTNPRAARMVLDELVGEGLLKKSGVQYSLAPEAALYLVSDSPVSMTAMLGHGDGLMQGWRQLAEVMRTGKPVAAVNDTATGEEFFRVLVRGLFAASYASANLLLPRVPLDTSAPLRVLDVAGGSAAWSLPFVQRYSRATGVVADLPGVLPVAREFAEKLGVADRYEYIPGDIRKTSFGTASFDLIILGHICHSEGAKWSKSLIKKCAAALKPGGWLVIPDMIPNDQRTGPVFPLLFAINMLINTSEGDTFTAAEYKEWTQAAGLKFVEVIPATMIGTEVAVARKSPASKRK